jgi:uncharacterized protein DUF4440
MYGFFDCYIQRGHSMKATSAAGTVATIVLLFASTLAAQTNDAQLRLLLESRYATMKTAMASRNEAAIRALLAPGFVSVDVNGNSKTVDQMIKEIAALPQDPKKKSETTLTSVTRNDDFAIVVQQYHMTTTRTPVNGSAPETIDLLTTSTDTWRLINGAWLIERTETNDLQYTINGTVVVHKSRPHEQ